MMRSTMTRYRRWILTTGMTLALFGFVLGDMEQASAKKASAKKASAKKVPVLPSDPVLAKAVVGIQGFYKNLNTFYSKFTQIFHRKGFRRPMKERGFFLYRKPAMMRFKYVSPEPKELIYSGNTLCMYDPEENEVKIRKGIKRDQLGVAFQFLWGSGNLHQTFRIKKAKTGFAFGQKGDLLLELVPRRPDALFKKLYFAVMPKSYQIRETIYTDAAGNRNRFVFSKSRINRKIPTKAFACKIPKGAKVEEIK